MPRRESAAPVGALSIDDIYKSIDAAAPALEALAREAETERRPPEALATLLRDARVPMSKAPRAVGGCELSPADQVDFFARLSYLNPTAGWISFNYSGILGMLGANLPDAGLAEIFDDGACPLVAAVSAPTTRRSRRCAVNRPARVCVYSARNRSNSTTTGTSGHCRAPEASMSALRTFSFRRI